MKVIPTYTFDASAKTVTFLTNIPSDLSRILAIINTTDNIVLYQPNKPTHGGTFASPVLTLTYDTTSMDDTDKLMIFVEDGLISIPAGENHIGEVGGNTVVVQATFQRPNNTTAYSALDVVNDNTVAGSATVITFTNAARINAGSGYITKARLVTDQSACVARFRLHLYSIAPTTLADNAPFTYLWANRANRIGKVDFDSMITEGSGSDAASSINKDDRIAFKCDTGTRNIIAVLETLDAFTPAAQQNFFIELTFENN